MIKIIIALMMLLYAAPVSAQIDKGCYNYSGQNVWTAKNADKLREDIACFKVAKDKADISIANREKRIAQLTPPTVGDVEPPELGELLDKVPEYIPSNFDVGPLIGQQWPVAKSGAPDVVGAFRFLCTPGQVLRDDPVVYPGQPGKSHLHQFFGNLDANAFSTYKSLRTSGKSTCVNDTNRSAYWIPAMLDGKGKVVRPDYISIYYKRRPVTDPWCKVQGKACVDLPRGLRFVFGSDMQFGTAKTGGGYFNCDGPTATYGHFATITEAAKGCPSGNRIGAIINAPDCWDGKHLDAPDHRSHVRYGDYSDGSGQYKCPASHPYIIPTFTLGAWYSVDEKRADDWYLSSDEMPGMPRMAAGSSLHADWFGAWDEGVMKTWTDHCINKLLNCSAGDLGNGTGLNQTPAFKWNAEPRLVDIPAR